MARQQSTHRYNKTFCIQSQRQRLPHSCFAAADVYRVLLVQNQLYDANNLELVTSNSSACGACLNDVAARLSSSQAIDVYSVGHPLRTTTSSEWRFRQPVVRCRRGDESRKEGNLT